MNLGLFKLINEVFKDTTIKIPPNVNHQRQKDQYKELLQAKDKDIYVFSPAE